MPVQFQLRKVRSTVPAPEGTDLPRDTRTQWSFLAFLCILLAGSQEVAKAADRHVVVISLDGFPAYLLDDPQASLPVLRKLSASGATATQGMRVANPSVTWPNHTTLMTGLYPEAHGVLFNGVLEKQKPGLPVRVNPSKTQAELVRRPLLFDLLKTAGLTSAAINWPCTRGSKSIADNFPDVPDALEHTSPQLKQELTDLGLTQRFEAGGGVVRDEIWTEAACQIIRRGLPRLLTLHLLNLDSTHHSYGPLTGPGYTASALLDAQVGRVLDALDAAKLRDRTTVIVVSDHGFVSVTKAIRPNAILRREGLITTEGNEIKTARAMVVSEGGTAMVYLTDPSTANEDRRTVRRLFENAEGIAAVVDSSEFPAYHYPLPSQNSQMADLVLAAKDGYSFSGVALGDELISGGSSKTGSHGYLSTNPRMNGLFIAAGAGIRPRSKLTIIDNVDIAPTVARLLDVELKETSGHVLSEILETHP